MWLPTCLISYVLRIGKAEFEASLLDFLGFNPFFLKFFIFFISFAVEFFIKKWTNSKNWF